MYDVTAHPVELVDRTAVGPVLVFGTPPPAGHDLDVLAGAADCERIRAALTAAGYTGNGRHWARFHGGQVAGVELVATPAWGIADEELAAAAEQGELLPGCTHIHVPGSAHALVLLALRFARTARLDSRLRARINRASGAAPDAWDRAAAVAPRWGAAAALAAMQQAYLDPDARPGTTSPLAELWAHRGVRWPRARAVAHAVARRRRRRGVIVAFSGLDGSGKSSRVAELQEALAALGYDVETRWTRLGSDVRLDRAAAPVKRVIRRLVRRPLAQRAPSRYAEGHAPPDAARIVREHSRALTHVWSLVVTIVFVAGQRRAVRAGLRSGQVVIADRWTLDGVVHLRYRYGDGRFPLHDALMRRAVPRPVVSFLVDVPAEEALRRKPEQYSLGHLQLQRLLYRRLAPAVGARVLDGTKPPAELADEVAATVWRALR